MNFDFSEDAKQIRAEAQRFLRERAPISSVRAHVESGAPYDAGLWTALADMGWLGVTIPEALGGVGLGYEAACVLAEEIGAVAAPVPFASTVYLAAEALLRFGSEAQQQRWLPDVAAGKKIGCFALAEGHGDPAADAVRASVADGVLKGEKAPVADGAAADFAIVVARSGGAPALFLVDLTQGGVERAALRTVDGAHPQAMLRFSGAAAAVLPRGRDWGAVENLLDRAAILFAFEQLGGARAALDMAVAHAKTRYAFGRPIGSFQAIKHKLADMYVAIEIARSNAYFGAWALEKDAAELPVAAAAARGAAIDAYHVAAKENIQTHGGMGFTWEADAHVHYTRAKALSLTIGSARHWKRALIARLDSRNEAAA